jgi:hypothetical protein
MRTLILIVALAVFTITTIGCACRGEVALKRHAELEWQLRREMPAFTPAQWNAWEAELAAALNLPRPQPPLFPAAADADPEPESGE